jgi:hypothetical protein
VLVRTSLATGASNTVRLFGRMEVDDHNNPAVSFWRGRLWAFAGPHSGHVFPHDRRMFVHYRVSREPYGIRGGFGPVQRVPLAKGCGLGYTYPNPVVAEGRLYLFLRGPCMQPVFTSTRDGVHWTRERTLVLGAPRRGGHRRPYAKYAGGPAGISMLFSEAHPFSYPTSLYYMRLQGGRLYRADGTLIGGLADLPFEASQLDRVYIYTPGTGRAWPMDVAVDGIGRPVVLYSTTWGDGDLHTADGGVTFTRQMVTAGSAVQNFRPVLPRGLQPSGRVLLEWISGLSPTFHEFDTVLELTSVPVG